MSTSAGCLLDIYSCESQIECQIDIEYSNQLSTKQKKTKKHNKKQKAKSKKQKTKKKKKKPNRLFYETRNE